MISCIVFNCAGVNSYHPIRFAGTWKHYSKKAMPQLTTLTFHSDSLRNRKCPYHCNRHENIRNRQQQNGSYSFGLPPQLRALSGSQALGRKTALVACEQTPFTHSAHLSSGAFCFSHPILELLREFRRRGYCWNTLRGESRTKPQRCRSPARRSHLARRSPARLAAPSKERKASSSLLLRKEGC
jgi:hypothetical protein